MQPQGPDYESYSLDELEDALSQLDRDRFPERCIELQEWIAKRREEQPDSEVAVDDAYYGEAIEPVPDENKLWVWFWQGLLVIVLALDMLVLFDQAYIPAAWWGEWVFTQVLVYTIAISGVFYWYVAQDNFFSRNLKRRSRYWQFIIVFAPFLFAIFLYPLVMYVIPTAGHELATYNRYEYTTTYQLKTRRKGCHYRAELYAAEGLTQSTICISKRDYDLMAPSGKIEVAGNRSMWGLTVTAYRAVR